MYHFELKGALTLWNYSHLTWIYGAACGELVKTVPNHINPGEFSVDKHVLVFALHGILVIPEVRNCWSRIMNLTQDCLS